MAENYGTPITISELVGHYDYHKMGKEDFERLLTTFKDNLLDDIIEFVDWQREEGETDLRSTKWAIQKKKEDTTKQLINS